MLRHVKNWPTFPSIWNGLTVSQYKNKDEDGNDDSDIPTAAHESSFHMDDIQPANEEEEVEEEEVPVKDYCVEDFANAEDLDRLASNAPRVETSRNR